ERQSGSSSPRVRPASTSAGHFPHKQPPPFLRLPAVFCFYSVCILYLSVSTQKDYREGCDGGVPVKLKAEKIFSSGSPTPVSLLLLPASEAMGCGLRKLEDPEDSSPGKIYSTLKRPQVETKTEDCVRVCAAGLQPGRVHSPLTIQDIRFPLEVLFSPPRKNRVSRPTVQYVSSLSELPQALQPYYTQGYVLTALHPIILSVGRSRSLPFSLLVPMLKVEEWPLPGDSLTSDTVRALIDRVNSSARGGVRFVGSVLQQVSGVTNAEERLPFPPRSPPRTPPGDAELEEHTTVLVRPSLQAAGVLPLLGSGLRSSRLAGLQYHQGALSMRVSRKGQVVSSLEADWLELTAAYYRKGWSLVDSFVYREKITAHIGYDRYQLKKSDFFREPVPRSLEGLFVYEERSTSPPANDTIVVEQWTVIEGSNVKTDYGPLLHTLAEFGWLLTCVLPTPIIRHD
ncbi:hypothetical protein F7725_002478, partial [Dissostichus mawsoni]